MNEVAVSGRRKKPYLIRDISPPPADLEARATSIFAKSRRELIADAAYYKAERRGFQGGDPDQDWREAEAEIEALLSRGRPF